MKKTIAIRVIIGVVVGIFLVSAWVHEGKPDWSMLKLFSTAVFVCTVMFNVWDFWLWRLPWIQRIPGMGIPRTPPKAPGKVPSRPSGWIRQLNSNPRSQSTVYLVVHQTASLVTVRCAN
ncbi:SMODS-associating 2TM beta-strand rich effector domain-containing protein OS=Streptomyces fumanus OX=67302 GN=GCM10018772_58470 PE=4 SV=1 [Streptomyces fumanus]